MNKIFACLVTVGLLLSGQQAFAVAVDNPLPYYNKDGNPSVLFSDIAIRYVPGHALGSKGRGKGKLFARDTCQTQYFIRSPSGDQQFFEADFKLSAKITRDGEILGGSFLLTSTDEMFGFGTEEVCNKKGRKCSTRPVAGTVVGGDLTDFGWSGTEGFLEFATANLYGWAADMYGATGTSEHLWFDMEESSMKAGPIPGFWRGKGDGMAIVPLPGAVWLFGAGFMAVIGVAKRKGTRVSAG